MLPDVLKNVSRESFLKLEIYHAQLVKWQKAVNLVSPSTLDDVWNRHFADSAQIADLIPEGGIVADLGSGAGFPGMVLAILRPDLELHLIESDDKKCQFLSNVSRETKQVVAIHSGRVEQILPALKPGVITARAFAPLRKILDYVWDAGQVEAKLILLKGKRVLEEVAEAQSIYDFTLEKTPSVTEPDAQILLITELAKKH